MPLDQDGGYVDGSVPVVPVPQPGFLSAAQQAGEGYDRYNIRQSTELFSGLMQLPLAAPPGTGARIVRVAAPRSSKVITWVIETIRPAGERPVLPHWDTGEPNEVCIYAAIRPENPIIQADGVGFFWRVTGEYHYASISGTVLVWPNGATPSCVLPPESFGLSESDFSRDFLRATGSTASPSSVGGMVFDKDLR